MTEEYGLTSSTVPPLLFRLNPVSNSVSGSVLGLAAESQKTTRNSPGPSTVLLGKVYVEVLELPVV